jgi:hypothetical protein
MYRGLINVRAALGLEVPESAVDTCPGLQGVEIKGYIIACVLLHLALRSHLFKLCRRHLANVP